MLYRIGTEKEITEEMISKLPKEVMRELLHSTFILDYEYGTQRDYLSRGGYTLIAETKEDVDEIRRVICFEDHPCEWAVKAADYVSALYLLNDDYSIVVLIPISIAPEVLLKDMEEEK